ncbi:MAG: HEAT repeat domain-containing protein [Verrucomicrobia subdivision 3 bacterium]|nr:HEAT repeat domain-containing protein [Limisphaerales bacterium]
MLRAIVSGLFCAGGMWVSAAEPPVCPPDWSIELVASAPRINHPSVVCSAPDGRVFVAEDPMDISAPRADVALGRILCFHPDGRVTIFADKLHAVFGMQYLEGKLYVLHNPKFSVFTDQEGVGTKPHELIESTNPNPWALDWNDHVPANFRLGMDGFFYVAVGDKGLYGAVGRDGKRVDLHGGGILRLRPDGTQLEVFATGVRNILDVAMTDEDEIFTYDNTDEMEWMSRLTHMVEGGFYGYPYDFSPRRPYTLWMMADYGGGAATGTLCYNEDALPGEYHGNLFLADFGKRQILRVRVVREGATFRADSREDMFSRVPNDFYPVGICWSADARSMYICDWQHRDTKEKVAVGRLWKMTHKAPSRAAPRPEWYVPAAMGKTVRPTVGKLVSSLEHPSRGVRLTAQRLLSLRSGEAEEPLKRLLRSQDASARARWHAMWAINAVCGDIVDSVNAGDASVARQALRKLGQHSGQDHANAVENPLRHSDASVRFHAATALGRIGNETSVAALLSALKDVESVAAYGMFTALNRIGKRHPQAWERIARGLLSEISLVRERTSFALRETYDERLVAALSSIVAEEENGTDSRALALRLLAELHRKRPEWKGEWWAYHPVKSPPPEKTVEWAGTPVVLQALRRALEDEKQAMRHAAVEGIRVANDADSSRKLRDMFTSEAHPELKRAIIETLGAIGDTNSGPLFLTVLRTGTENFQQTALKALGAIRFVPAAAAIGEICATTRGTVRATAFEALVKIGGVAALAALERPLRAESSEIRGEAIAAIGALKNRAALPLLLKAHGDPETRIAAIEALAEMPDARASEAFVEGLTNRSATLREKCRKALSAIRAEAWDTITNRLAHLPPGAIPELQRVYKGFGPARDSALFAIAVSIADPAQYAAFARENTGDPSHGRSIFFDTAGAACAKCHAVRGEGGTIGPDLSTVGAQFPREVLIESILYPSKAIREGYQQTMVELRDGESISGSVKGETGDAVTLQDGEGKLHTVRKAEISTRRASELSLMPEGLNAALSLQEFADLIAYLEGLRQ